MVSVHTFVGGFGSRMGHNLVLQASRWSGKATVDAGDPVASSIELTIDPRSLDVVQATGGLKPLSDGDKREIGRNRDRTLHADAHPEITFRSQAVGGGLPHLEVTGALRINGMTRVVTIDVEADEVAEGTRLSGSTTLLQSDFGIRPYSKLGALRVKDEVDVRFTLLLPR